MENLKLNIDALEQFQQYEKQMSRYNVDICTLRQIQDNINNDRIHLTVTAETFSRTASGKSWKSKPDSSEVENINAFNYACFLSSIPFFKSLGSERVTSQYTCYGLIPVCLTTISPDGTTKIIRRFKFHR